jgi:hypothetical protein
MGASSEHSKAKLSKGLTLRLSPVKKETEKESVSQPEVEVKEELIEVEICEDSGSQKAHQEHMGGRDKTSFSKSYSISQGLSQVSRLS